MKPLCSICSTPHEKWQAHVFPSVNTPQKVVNTEMKPVNTDRHSPGYMRMYMATMRAVKAGRAEWLK